MYGRRCQQDQIEHEVRVTDLALLFKDFGFERGVKVGRTEADAKTIYRGRRCYIEVDNSGKMTAKQFQAKWKRYEPLNEKSAELGKETELEFILVVALTESRMHRIRRTAELLKDIVLFTTFERLESGMPNPWVDWPGKTVHL